MKNWTKDILTEKTSKALIASGLLFVGLALVLFFWKEDFSISQTIDAGKIGQFGDFIGGLVGSLWALAGVVLFYVALTEQRKDFATNREVFQNQVVALNQQIKEFELQRKELEETRVEFKIQNETLRQQRFENTLFQMLGIHHEIVDKMSLSVGHDKPEKRQVLKQSLYKLAEQIKPDLRAINVDNQQKWIKRPTNSVEALQQMEEGYLRFYHGIYGQTLSHYFRNLYHIFKFIYLSDLVDNDRKQFYATLVRAQLSADELFLVFYNSVVPDLGYPNFMFLIREFDLLKNFDKKIIENYDFHEEAWKTVNKKAQADWYKPAKKKSAKAK